jgi:hypothetical protein
MNHWTKLSIDYANKRVYLDGLFQVYPTIPERNEQYRKTQKKYQTGGSL